LDEAEQARRCSRGAGSGWGVMVHFPPLQSDPDRNAASGFERFEQERNEAMNTAQSSDIILIAENIFGDTDGFELINGGEWTIAAAIRTLTPEIASSILESRNTDNFRKQSDDRARKLASRIEEGGWQFNGESIKFNSDGQLVDGQTRLLAIKTSGIPVASLVLIGIDQDENIDTGSPRTLAHHLEKMKVPQATKTACVIRNLHLESRGILHAIGAGGWGSASTSVLLSFYEKHKDVIESIRICDFNTPLMPVSLCATLHYLMQKPDKRDREAADKFWKLLDTGVSLQANDPVYLLRRDLEANKKTGKSKYRQSYMAAIAIKAWNYWKIGSAMKQLKWTSVGPSAESFPKIN
jgi:hypothetical protein